MSSSESSFSQFAADAQQRLDAANRNVQETKDPGIKERLLDELEAEIAVHERILNPF